MKALRSFSRLRRSLVQLLLAFCLVAQLAWSGSYLTRAAVLLDTADREASALRRRLHDKELAQVVHRTASARVSASRQMRVPEEVASAHPHLLLTLESYERAADAAVRGDTNSFLSAHARARQEAQTLRSILKQSGWTLPELK